MAQSELRHDRYEMRLEPALGTAPAVGGVQEELIDFFYLAGFMRRNLLLLIVAALLGGAAGYGISHLFPKTYRAEVLVVPAAFEQATPSLSSVAGRIGSLAALGGLELGGADRSTAVFLALLQSHRFIEEFITDRHLLPVLFANRWDAAASHWKSSANQPPPSLADGYDKFYRDVMTIIEDKKTGLVTVRIEWLGPEQAADWANGLIERVNATTRGLAMRDATQNIDYLNRELKTSETLELRQSIYSLLQAQMEKRMLASTRPEFAFRIIDPALVPELRKPVKPRRIIFAGAGLFFGMILGVIVAIKVQGSRSRTPP